MICHNSFVTFLFFSFFFTFLPWKKKGAGVGEAWRGAARRGKTSTGTRGEHEALSVCQQQGSECRCLAGCFCSPPRQITLDRQQEHCLIDAQSYPLHVINTGLMAGHLSSTLGLAQQKKEGGGLGVLGKWRHIVTKAPN